MFKQITLAISAALILLTAVAYADTTDIGSSGAWSSYAGSTHNGNPVCGVTTVWGARSDRSFHVKYDGDQLVLQLFKRGWEFPNNTKIKVEMQVDQAPGWAFNTVGYHDDPDSLPSIGARLHRPVSDLLSNLQICCRMDSN